MSIRLDPRRLSALKQLAGEAGLRPGELVLRWVEERLDAERRGGAGAGTSSVDVSALTARIDELAARIDALESAPAGEPIPAATPATTTLADSEIAPRAGAAEPDQPAKRRPGRPRKASPAPTLARPRVALHDEIIAVIEERGPASAAEIAAAIAERGRYTPPRSGKGLSAATVNGRVSNPAYRDRFTRQDGRIGLAGGA
jgi:hypothetical protein